MKIREEIESKVRKYFETNDTLEIGKVSEDEDL